MNTVISFDVGIVNLGLWIGTLDQENPERIVTTHWELIDLRSNTTLGNATLRLVDALNQRRPLFQQGPRTYVVIETQPNGNPSMRTLSHVIQAWFYLQSFVEGNIKFVSARNKLTVYTKPLEEPVHNISGAYRYRKELSVSHTRAMLRDMEEPEWAKFLERHFKKDDLADAYLQGCHALRRFYTADQRAERRVQRLSKANKPVPVVESHNAVTECSMADDNVEPVDSGLTGLVVGSN